MQAGCLEMEHTGLTICAFRRTKLFVKIEMQSTRQRKHMKLVLIESLNSNTFFAISFLQNSNLLEGTVSLIAGPVRL